MSSAASSRLAVVARPGLRVFHGAGSTPTGFSSTYTASPASSFVRESSSSLLRLRVCAALRARADASVMTSRFDEAALPLP